jgi:hypothetical protein
METIATQVVVRSHSGILLFIRYLLLRRFFHKAALLLVLALACSSPGTSRADLVTGNQFVWAKVDAGTGLISISEFPGVQFGEPLSYPEHSYLNVMINGRYFTNNSYPPDTGNVFALRNPVLSMSGDTIICIWPKVYGVNVIQKVYPVLFSFAGQIVMSFSFQNPKGGVAATVQAQFLLDTDPGAADKAKILTPYQYNLNWTQYPLSGKMPWWFANFQHDLPGKNYNVGVSGQGMIDDGPIGSPLGLIVPDAVVVGDWYALSNDAWWNGPLRFGPYTDSGVLFEWMQQSVPPGQTVEVGRTSYGTGLFFQCVGNLVALSMYPDPLKLDASKTHYIPNPFHVYTFLVNPDSLAPASGVTLALHSGPYLTIDSPLTRTNPSHTIDTQSLATFLPADGVAELDWILDAALYKTCLGDTTTHFSLTAHSIVPGPPYFADTCLPQVTLPSIAVDLDPPVVWIVDTSALFHDSLAVTDSRCTDYGLQSITFVYTGPDQSKFAVKYAPSFQPCDKKDTVVVSVAQLDSTVGGCFDFTFTDCAGNKSYATMCFKGHKYVPPDTVPPIFTLLKLIDTTNASHCSAQGDSLRVEDDSLYDRGLFSVTITPKTTPVNMVLHASYISPGQPQATFTVSVIDSMQNGWISVRGLDLWGNYRDTVLTYCTTPDTHPPVVSIKRLDEYDWLVRAQEPNPWDRGIDSIVFPSFTNVRFSIANIITNPTFPPGTFDTNLTVSVIDTSKLGGFCVYATDNAGNASRTLCSTDTTVADRWPPTIQLIPSTNSNLNNPASMDVYVGDVHYYGDDTAHDLIGWDLGVQRVWFTNVRGITVPTGFPLDTDCVPSIPSFRLFVTDTLSTDTIPACITINALDCAGNTHDTTWCYSYYPDINPPTLLGLDTSYTTILLHATDSLSHDRGIDTIYLDPAENFDPLHVSGMGVRTWDGAVHVTTPGQSAFGVLRIEDVWGSLSPTLSVQQAHSASVEVHSWVQNYSLYKGIIFYPSDFPTSRIVSVPLRFVLSDTFSLARKNITQYSFSFDLNGDPQITFAGTDTTKTASSGWTVTSANSGTLWTVNGEGKALSDSGKPLINLLFQDAIDLSTRKATVEFIGTPFGIIQYNGGSGDTIVGRNATAISPAPYGVLTGATIVVAGTCAPNTVVDTIPHVPSIDPPHPNPASAAVKLDYTVGTEGLVSLVVYDEMGREVSRLVTQNQKPGYYSVVFDAAQNQSGTYFVRLESGGTVVTRRLVLQR